MKVAIVRGGGLAGIPTTTRLQADALPGEEAKELESKVRGSSLLSAAEPAPEAGASHPDDLLYEVTVEDGGAQHTHRFSDADMPEGVRALIEWVDGRPEREFQPGA